MTGIWNFNLLLAIFSVASMLLPLQAADISLSDGCRLTGELLAMDADGTITLASPLSQKPLLLLGEKVSHVGFKTQVNKESELPGQRLELINGDILPVTISRLDEAGMLVVSPDMGEVWIPRNLISALQLGVVEENLVYSGGDDLSGWNSQGNEESWVPEDGWLVAQDSGSLVREVDLPEKFILRFRLKWSQQPNFRLTFADPSPEKSSKVERYYFDLNSSNLSILRDSEELRSPKPIMMLGRTANRFSGNVLEVEIRGDLTRGLLHLYLDGVLEGRFADPLPQIPRGSGLSITNRAPQNSVQKISEIEVAEWDERGDRHRSEDRGDGSADALIGRYGERFGGELLSVTKDGDARIYEFKSDFQKEPLLLPESEVSTVFFADGENEESRDGGGLILRLRGNGEMKLSSCVFGKETVEAVHPLLGAVKVKRDGITALEKRDIPKANPIKE